MAVVSSDKPLERPGIGGVYSALVGAASRLPVPKALRGPAYRTFAKAVGANLAEVGAPLGDYPTLGAFFTRSLRVDARPIAANAGDVVAPCDGLLAACGDITQGMAMQAKGKQYSVAALLANAQQASAFDGGTFATIYLSPKDYHRVHAPVAGKLTSYRYVPGALFPVFRRFVEGVDGLFARNERVVMMLETALGPVAVVMVGAAGVGNIWLSHWGRDTKAMRSAGEVLDVAMDEPVATGTDLGAFQLGSTVILLLPKQAQSVLVRGSGDVVQFGQTLARRSA